MDLYNHKSLKGKVYQRQQILGQHIISLASLGVAGLAYAYFPLLAGIMGSNLTSLAITASVFNGAYHLRESSNVKSIEFISEGEKKGMVMITVSNGILSSKSYYCSIN